VFTLATPFTSPRALLTPFQAFFWPEHVSRCAQPRSKSCRELHGTKKKRKMDRLLVRGELPFLARENNSIQFSFLAKEGNSIQLSFLGREDNSIHGAM